MSARHDLVEGLLDLLWRQWTTLGVAGVNGAEPIAIDLEALLILTAQLSRQDPRLRDEALDWCAKSHRFISKPRLKQLLKLTSDTGRVAFAPFAATLHHQVGGTWPTAENAERWKVSLSTKSRAPELEEPALINLKLRALFGVSARADIIAAILHWPAPDFGAADLVWIGYTKRNLADALDGLADAGLLASVRVGNRLRFSWRKRRPLIRLVEPLPTAIPRWPPIARVLGGFLELLERTEAKSDRAAVVEAVRMFELLKEDLKALGVEPPSATKAPLKWQRVIEWVQANSWELPRGRQGVAYEVR